MAVLWLRDFSGGLNNRFRQNRIADKESIALRNARWNRVGALTKRLGTTRTAMSASGLGAINTIFAKEGSSTEELLMSDGDQVAVVGTSLTGDSNIITGLNNEWPPEFLTFNGATYMINGNDTARKITTANGVSTIASYPAARFHVAHQGYVFTLNQDTGGNRNRLQWSTNGDPESWPSTNFEDIQPFGNSVGLGLYSLGDELIVFQGPNYTGSARVYNTGKIYRILGDVFDPSNPTYLIEEIPMPPDVGLLGNAHRAVKALGGELIFPTNNGFYKYLPGGGMPVPISESMGGDIDNWEKADINAAIRMAAAAVWKNEYVCSLYNDSVSADGYNNRIYLLDIQKKWLIDILDSGSDNFSAGGGTGSCFTIFNGSLYGCTGSEAAIRQYYVDNAFSDNRDGGTTGSVNFSFLTREFDLDKEVYFTHCYVHLRRQSSGTLTFEVNLDQRGATSNSIDMTAPDDGSAQTSSSAVLRKRVNIEDRGQTIQFRFHNRAGVDVEIYAVELYFEQSDQSIQ